MNRIWKNGNSEQRPSNIEHRVSGRFQRSMFSVRCSMFFICTITLAASLEFALAEKFILKDATIHTVSGETLSPGEVSIDGATILEVGAKVKSSGAKIISLKGLHLYPGLIALDTAVGLSEISGVRSTRDNSEVGDYTPEVQSWIAVNPDSELIPVARANGVTHIEPAPQGGIVAGQSALVALTGWTSEQMAIKQPAGLHVYWPNMELDTRPKDKFKDKSKWKSPEEQAKERQIKVRLLEDFFDEARAYATAFSASKTKSTPAPERNPSWESMLPFLAGEAPIMVHADDLRQIKAALTGWNHTNTPPRTRRLQPNSGLVGLSGLSGLFCLSG